MVLLVATQKLRYAAKEYQIGEQLEASERDAKLLRAIRKAKDVSMDEVEPVPPRRARLPRQTSATEPPVSPSSDTPAPPLPPELTKELPTIAEPKPELKPEPEPVSEQVEPSTSAEPLVETEKVPTSTTTRYKRRDLQAQE